MDQDHEVVVRLLLERGGDIKVMDEWHVSPLRLAVGKGQEAVVRLLLEKRANIWAEDSLGRTPL